jgi:hypothetical protein
MSLKNPRRIVYETMVALSEGKVSIDHCFAMAKLAHEERGMAAEDRLHLELAIANSHEQIDYQQALHSITLEAIVSEPLVGIPT